MMEDEYTLIRSPIMDKTKWIEKLKYDVLRFSIDSIDLNLLEIGNAFNAQIAPIRLCMCNMHTSSCNESLTLKIGTIQLRQLLRLYPESWLEAGSVHIPELRINAKFDCHPPTAVNINEQLEFLRRHDQHTQRLHFLYNVKSQLTTNSKRPSSVGLPTNLNNLSCACLGGSPHYYTLISGEQFFKSTFRLSEQPTFGRSLFRPDVHVVYSHRVFEQKYNWNIYENKYQADEQQLNAEEIFYPFDFCAQQKLNNNGDLNNFNDNQTTTTTNLYSLSRSTSVRHLRKKPSIDKKLHKRSSSSIPINQNTNEGSSSSSTTTSGDVYSTASEYASLHSSKPASLNNIIEPTSIPNGLNYMSRTKEEKESLSTKSSNSSSTDSLTAFEEILQNQQSGHMSSLSTQKVNILKCLILNRVFIPQNIIPNS